MTMYDILIHKREHQELTDAEISYFIDGILQKTIPDYQTAALLMAISIQGMTDRETAILTQKMAESGDIVDLSPLGPYTVDKHSSGGVGDKTTFLAAPIAAAAGSIVAKMSGRGLGHTGGTVDKLESVEGVKTDLSPEKFFTLAQKNGLVIAGQSENLAPADKILYALRDVTATVSSIPLIASSIMSKKLAGGSRSIVLDIKVGSGAFLKTKAEATALARQMISIGTASGRQVTAVLSNMDTPLGSTVGNALELWEAARLLHHPVSCDLLELSLALAAEMIALSQSISIEAATAKAKEALNSGAALRRLTALCEGQGGILPDLLADQPFRRAGALYDIRSPYDGYITAMNTEGIGLVSTALGAGRRTKTDKIDPAAGLQLHKKTGDAVKKGQPLVTLAAADISICKAAESAYLAALTFGETPPPSAPLILDILH